MTTEEIAVMLSHLSPEHLEIIEQLVEEKMNAHNRTTDTPFSGDLCRSCGMA